MQQLYDSAVVMACLREKQPAPAEAYHPSRAQLCIVEPLSLVLIEHACSLSVRRRRDFISLAFPEDDSSSATRAAQQTSLTTQPLPVSVTTATPVTNVKLIT